MIAIIVDSNSQLPESLAQRFDIRVVPLTVTIDGVDYLEGVDIDEHRFYDSWSDGHQPAISTSQPSPGAFMEVYEQAIADGATEILSMHISEAMSGTLNSARIAAGAVSVPVRLFDTETASFGISVCAWAAAEVIASGGSVDEAEAVARVRAARLGTAFIVGVPAAAERSGRVDGVGVEAAAANGIPVLSMHGGDIAVLDTVTTIDAAVAAMRNYALRWEPSASDGLRIAIGTSDISSGAITADLTDALRAEPKVGEIVQYTIGPTVGAHTGPGTAGLFVF